NFMAVLLNFEFVWGPCWLAANTARFRVEAFSTHRDRVPIISETPVESMITALQGTGSLPAGFTPGPHRRRGGQLRKIAGKQSSNQKRWCDGFGGFSQTSSWLRPDDRAHPVSTARPSLAAPILCLAKLRSVPGIS